MASNPRKVITPDAFVVAPSLLGIALARPSRRLAAIAIDGILLSIVAQAGGKLLFTAATALLLWKAARPLTSQSQGKARLLLRVASVALVTISLVLAYNWVQDRIRPSGSRDGAVAAADSADAADVRDANDTTNAGNDDSGDDDTGGGSGFNVNVDDVNLGAMNLSLRDARILPLMNRISDARDSAAAAPLADSLSQWIATHDDSTHTVLAATAMGALESAPGSAAVRVALARFQPAEAPAADSAALIARYERRADALAAEVNELKKTNKDLREEIENPENEFTFSRLLRRTKDVLGFGLGYSALYFTGFMLLFGGQTPGKKLLGIRVIRLDGRPLSAWMAFERFGGYAASTATGLLGFAQILWDRNRQALHDKVTETVVIREQRGTPVRYT